MFGILKKIKRILDERKIYYETYAELMSMNDRELADIGISRGDIPFIAVEATKMKSQELHK